MSLRIVIVGGVAGGMSAATRARRLNEDARITVLEKNGFISFANCGLPYYLAGQIEHEQDLLITTPQQVRTRFNIDARVRHEVTRIDRQRREVHGIDQRSGQPFQLGYDKLILATGASAIVPPIEHVGAPNVFLLRSMEDTQAVRQWLVNHHPRSAVIVGAGFIGLEMAEAMRQRGLEVTLVEKAPHVLPPLDAEMATPVAEELARNNVHSLCGDGLEALQAEGGIVTAVATEHGRRIAADLVLLSIGVQPNVALARGAGLTIGPSGGIGVDRFQRSSDSDIYAVGDVSEVMHGVSGAASRIPLAGPANRQGRLAGEHAATGHAAPAGSVLGTAIVKVFDLSVGMTGLAEAAANAAGFTADAAYVSPKHHAGYYPGAQAMRIKLIYDHTSGRLLGGQIVGKGGVDKRLDVLATTLHFGGTSDDLAALDLAYAPQFGSAKDPVHLAAMVAQNQRRGLMPAISPTQLNGQLLLDVRNPAEFTNGSLPGAINIPLDQLRRNPPAVDLRQPIVTFCQIGQRGYIAQRILKQMGFSNVVNLKGGYSLAQHR